MIPIKMMRLRKLWYIGVAASWLVITAAGCGPPSASWQNQGESRVIESKNSAQTLAASGQRYNTDADPPAPRRRYKRQRGKNLFLDRDLAAQSFVTPPPSRLKSSRPSTDFSQSPIKSPERTLIDFGDRPQQKAIQSSSLPLSVSPRNLSAYPHAIIDIVEGLVTPFKRLFPECVAYRFLQKKTKDDQVDDSSLFKSCNYYLDILRIRIAEFNRLNKYDLNLNEELTRLWFQDLREQAQTQLDELKQHVLEDKPFTPPRHPAILAQELLQ